MVFNNDESLFLEKKRAFVENANLYREMSGLHSKMKVLPDGTEKANIATNLVAINNQIQENWKIVDSKLLHRK